MIRKITAMWSFYFCLFRPQFTNSRSLGSKTPREHEISEKLTGLQYWSEVSSPDFRAEKTKYRSCWVIKSIKSCTKPHSSRTRKPSLCAASQEPVPSDSVTLLTLQSQLSWERWFTAPVTMLRKQTAPPISHPHTSWQREPPPREGKLTEQLPPTASTASPSGICWNFHS